MGRDYLLFHNLERPFPDQLSEANHNLQFSRGLGILYLFHLLVSSSSLALVGFLGTRSAALCCFDSRNQVSDQNR